MEGTSSSTSRASHSSLHEICMTQQQDMLFRSSRYSLHSVVLNHQKCTSYISECFTVHAQNHFFNLSYQQNVHLAENKSVRDSFISIQSKSFDVLSSHTFTSLSTQRHNSTQPSLQAQEQYYCKGWVGLSCGINKLEELAGAMT